MSSEPAAAGPDRFGVALQELALREGLELERALSPSFWRKPVKGDLAEAVGNLPAPAGELTAFMRRAMFEGLWAWIREAPEPATLRRYFSWAAHQRVQLLARTAARAAVDVHRTRSESPPANLERLPGGLTIWRSYIAAVRLEFRRQQAHFDMWAESTGLLTHRDHGVENDALAGWKPNLDVSALIPHQRDTYRAAGQRALNILRAHAGRGRAGEIVVSGDFSVDDPTLKQRIDRLLFDQVVGIDATTVDILTQILSDDGGTIDDLAQAISDAWDEASLVRAITIASTEMARAAALAELDTYRENGVEMVEFSGGPSDDECDEYVGEQYPADSFEAMSLIPVHPRCTHYWAPVIPSSWSLPSPPWAGGPLEEEAA